MSVRSNSNYKRREDEGEFELVLVAVTYTGSRSMFGPQGMRTEGGYPSLDQFRGPGPGEQAGETKLVELPSGRLGWWENHANFEVSYEEEAIAECLLSANYIPEQIAGPGFDQELREKLTERLDLEPFSGEQDLREQLREIADTDEVDEGGGAEQEGPGRRVERLTGEYDRSVLMKAAGSYDDIDGVLDEEGKKQVSHLESTAMAEFLAGKDDDEVDRRLATAEQGGEV